MAKKEKLYSYEWISGNPIKRRKEQIKVLRTLIKQLKNENALEEAINKMHQMQKTT